MSTAGASTAQLIGERVIKRSDIIWDKKLWPRKGLDTMRVDEFAQLYKEEPGALPPIKVAEHPTQKGKYRGFDGWHRNAALDQIKRLETKAEVYSKDTDIYAEAVRASAISSKPLTRLEKRAAVRKLLDEHKNWSDGEIARTAGVSQPFVSAQRRGLKRLMGELQDMAATVLEPAPDQSRSASYERARQEDPSIDDLLLWVLEDTRVGQVSLTTWTLKAIQRPELKPVMRHIATVLYQASQAAAPAQAAQNVMSVQKPAGRS